MDNITHVIKTIRIGLVVAIFLLKTGRALQAIELCKECLISLVNNKPRFEEDQFTKLIGAFYVVIFKAYYKMCDYTNAERYAREVLDMCHDSGDTDKDEWLSLALADIYQKQNRFVEAEELYERVIMKANGDRDLKATAYMNLGVAFSKLGKYQKTIEYIEKALSIIVLGKYRKANELFQKAHRIRMEIGGRKGEADYYRNQASLFSSLGDHQKAKEYLGKALAIILEIGDREKEAEVYELLGFTFLNLREYTESEEYYEKARLLSSCIGDSLIELKSLLSLTALKLFQSNIQEINLHLLQCIQTFENLRNANNDNDQFKLSLLEKNGPYQLLSVLLCCTDNPQEALNVEELGRARALADLMAAQYSVENNISADPQSWSRIKNIMKNESNCTCLYISYFDKNIFVWVLTTTGDIHFRRGEVNENTLRAELVVDLGGLFNKSFRTFGILPREKCEDRSLDDTVPISLHDENRATFRGNENKDTDMSLHLFHKIVIAPLADLLTEPEIIIVPDRSLYRVPFAALRVESEKKYLSDNFRIRIVPSLTTLKLIQDSPVGYHSQTGALIVGDPKVGEVLYKGSLKNFDITPLPCARKEA